MDINLIFGLTQGVPNKGIILPVTLIILVLVVTVLILMLVKPDSRRRVAEEKTNNSVIDRCNRLIKEYKDITTELSASVYIKSREISLYQDEEALHVLKTYVTTANKKDADMHDYISRARECASINDIVGLNYVVQAMESDLYIFEDIVRDIKNLKVKDMTARTDTDYSRNQSYWYKGFEEQQVASDTTVYFKGCKTKEELTARYKNLAKTLHPDTKGGNTTAFQEMKEEYDTLVKGLS